MNQPQLRALVADDEGPVRRLVGAALGKEGFACDFASDGIEALERLVENRYDLTVIDLWMPQRNGSALAGDVLRLEHRPVLIVLTGLLDPALAKSLLNRGVDDIVFKPVNFAAFAAKARGLVERRRQMARRDEFARGETAPYP